jgi:acyl dehydratase
MPLHQDLVGRRYEPFEASVCPDRAQRYAEVTGAGPQRYRERKAVHPFLAVQLAAPAFDLVLDDEALAIDRNLVLHAEQEMSFHRALAFGETVTVETAITGVANYGLGQACIFATTLRGADGRVAVAMVSTLAVAGADPTGTRHDPPPLPPATDQVAEVTVRIEDDTPARYAEASGDRNLVHLDPEVAVAAGLPGVIVHGLCTMATGATAAIGTLADADPGALAFMRARFSKPVLPGDDIAFRFFASDRPRQFVMKATVAGRQVVRDSYLVLR